MRHPLPTLLVSLAALVSAPALGAHAKAPAGGAVHLPVTTFKLKNGLTVLVHEDHTVPLVGVDLWYHVGSKEERPGRTGFAHLFEHMMFQGSAHVGDDEHLRLVSQSGGTANATTSQDRTNFFEVVPSNYLERMLFLESDRMGFLLDTLTKEKLDNQRDVVRNERRQSYENRPYGMVPFAIHEAIYPPEHPYHHLTIGAHEDLEAASVDDVKDFFRTWYTPANASLAIAGDVTVKDARALAEKYFGAIPSRPAPPHASAPPVKLATDKRVHLEDRVSLDRLYLSWPSPAGFAAGDAELDLLSAVLGSKSGRLYKKLVYEKQVAQSVDVMQASAKLGSLFEIVVTAKPGHDAAEMEKLVDEELRDLLGPRPVTEAELTRAKNQWEATFVYSLEPVGGPGGRADRLNEYLYDLGQADGFDRDRRRYLDATVESVNRQARQVMGAHRLSLTVAPLPKGAAPSAASIQRTRGDASATEPSKKPTVGKEAK
jgi:zinc protease